MAAKSCTADLTALSLISAGCLDNPSSIQPIQTVSDRLPRCDALFIPGNSEGADPLSHETWRILSVLALNLKGAGPKFAIIHSHGSEDNVTLLS